MSSVYFPTGAFALTFRTDKRAQAQLLVAACNVLLQY